MDDNGPVPTQVKRKKWRRGKRKGRNPHPPSPLREDERGGGVTSNNQTIKQSNNQNGRKKLGAHKPLSDRGNPKRTKTKYKDLILLCPFQVHIFHFTPTDIAIPDDISVDSGGELSLLQNAAPESLSLSADKLEAELDTRALDQARQKDASESGEVLFEQRHVSEAAEAAMVVAREGYNLLIIGRGRKPSSLIGAIPNQAGGRYLGRGREEAQGLGHLGEILVGQFNELNSSLLVVQQFDAALVKASLKTASFRIGPLFDTPAVEGGGEGEVLEHAE